MISLAKHLVFLGISLLIYSETLIAKADELLTRVQPIDLTKKSEKLIEIKTWLVTNGSYAKSSSATKSFWATMPQSLPVPEIETKAKGIATFRINLRFAEKGHWGVFALETKGTSRFWLNGEPVTIHGNPGESADSHQLLRGNHLYFFNTEAGEVVEIAFELANWSRSDGMGFYKAPLLGSAEAINKYSSRQMGVDQLMFGALIIMGFYHFALFYLRPTDKMNIYFAFYCIVIALRATLSGDGHIFATQFPAYAGGTSWKVELILVYISFSLIQFFIRELFPKFFKKNVCITITIISIGFTIVTMVASLDLMWEVLKCYQILLIIGAIYDLSIVLWAYKNGDEDASIFLYSGLVLFVVAINDVLNFQQIINSVKLITFGVLAFIFSNSYLISRRFSNAFKRAEKAELDLRILNKDLEFKVEEQTRDIISILNNIKQGILIITSPKNYAIGHHYSYYLNKILGGENLEGANAIDLIFKDSNLSKDSINRIQAVIDSAMGEEMFSWELNEKNLVNEYMRTDANQITTFFEIDWIPILKNELIEKILVTIRDVTSLRVLQTESLRKQRDLKLISEIVNTSPRNFAEFVKYANQILNDNFALIKTNNSFNRQALRTMFINLHTLKGISRSYEFDTIANSIHDAENTLNKLQNRSENWNRKAILSDLYQCNNILKTYIELGTTKLGRGVDDQFITIDNQILENYVAKLKKIDLDLLDNDQKKQLLSTIDGLENMLITSAKTIFRELSYFIPKLAKELGKVNPTINLTENGVIFNKSQIELVKYIFTHLLRNSLDHGLETEEERLAKGKIRKGVLNIDIQENSQNFLIKYSDDGKGLNLKQLEKIGVAKNLLTKERGASAISVANLIFCEGISTVDQVTQISGRGVGMNAIKTYLNNFNGDINIHLIDNKNQDNYQSFYFEIIIPKKLKKAV